MASPMQINLTPGSTMCHSSCRENDPGPVDSLSDNPMIPEAFDKLSTKKLIRKLDFHLIPFLALIYLLCYLDRTNVGNARLFTLERDLHMTGLDYNIALAIFFPFYVAAEIPSNIMLKLLRPSIWFTTIMVAWAVVMICTGFVRDFHELLVCRVFLGIAEGGLFPGVTYFITMWYRRHECGFRIALFFSAATAAGAFGGLIARGISEMDGVGGRAAFAYWAINDYPATAQFLTGAEKVELERRLTDDGGFSDDFNLKFVWQAIKDWKIWMMMLITIGIFTTLYSISLFLPTIIKQFGYSANESQLLTVPPYVFACIITIFSNYSADNAGQRGIFILGFAILSISGLLVLVISENHQVRYGGVFLITAGIFALVPLIRAWTSNNIGGSLKRGVGIAMQVGFGNLGGVIAAFVYRSMDAPRFIQGHFILIGLFSFSFALTFIMTLFFRHENVRRDSYLVDRNLSPESLSEELKIEEREKGDDAIFYRYTV